MQAAEMSSLLPSKVSTYGVSARGMERSRLVMPKIRARLNFEFLYVR